MQHPIKQNIKKFGTKEYAIFFVLYLLVLCGTYFAGEKYNTSHISMCLLVFFVIVLYIKDVSFVVEYSWTVIMFGLNVLGVYVCENSSINLVEQNLVSRYTNATSLLVVFYVIFWGTIELLRLGNKNKEKYKNNCKHKKTYSKMILWIGVCIVAILFIQVARTPYFSYGTDRIAYAQNHMGGWELSLKSYLPLFVPIAVFLLKAKKKIAPSIFLLMLILYYLWCGDKFGAFFQIGYIIVICCVDEMSERQFRKAFFAVLTLFISLLVVVYFQRIMLYDADVNAFFEYLYQRLSNQGGTWWGTYARYKATAPRWNEFGREIVAIMPFSDINPYEVGQWKMMQVSAGFSDYSKYRVGIANPYTATTTASLFYHFGKVITAFFYFVFAFFYYHLIENLKIACANRWSIESMVLIKILISFHYLLTASDLYILSYKGLVYLIALYVIQYLRKHQITFNINKH